MKLIPSFQVDHTNLRPGIYISRTDTISCIPTDEAQAPLSAPSVISEAASPAPVSEGSVISTDAAKAPVSDASASENPNLCITTYDIRMTSPNQEPALAPSAIHTIEHIVATYLRNDPEWKERIVYWGPMGCLTGNYLIMKGKYDCEEVRQLMISAFQYVVDYDMEVPGTTPATCGNYLLHDLPMAKWEAKRYVERLKNEFCCEYPGIERPQDASGLMFHDA